jgi:predicted nuclease of restriction endonuclease-like (RecB) superfamily
MKKSKKSGSAKGELIVSGAAVSAPALEASFVEVVDLIQKARQRAFQAVNTELIDLYWRVGEYISRKLETAAWGEGVVEQLAAYIARQHADLKGFTQRNLFRMRQFYETYRGDEKVAPLVRQLPWTHNLMILSRSKRPEEREFYLRLAIQERWSSRDLERQLNSALFERAVLSPPIVSALLTQLHPLAQTVFKDSYLIDFLDLPEVHSEQDLQRGLVANLRKFLLELGADFTFVGEQFRVQVGGRDFFLDLLFFHRGLNALVAFELKVEDFQPEHLGKLAFYLEALDRDVRKPHENPSIGVLLCATKNHQVVEYALSRILSPALVAEYQTRLPDKKLLQAKLLEFYELATEAAADSPALPPAKSKAKRRREER